MSSSVDDPAVDIGCVVVGSEDVTGTVVSCHDVSSATDVVPEPKIQFVINYVAVFINLTVVMLIVCIYNVRASPPTICLKIKT